MITRISSNDPKSNRTIKALFGFVFPMIWPAFIWKMMVERADPRAGLMQAWYMYAIYSLMGVILWIILNKLPRLLKNIFLFGIPLLSIVLIYYAVALYASRGDVLYIGNLLFKDAGILGNIVFAISITSLLILSEPLKQIPYSTALLVFFPYLISFLSYNSSTISNLLLWILVLAGTIGYLNLVVDLLFYLRWEILDAGEHHA